MSTRSTFHLYLALALATTLYTGCVTPPTTGGRSMSARAAAAGTSSMANVILGDELRGVEAATLFEALTMLRPEYLRRTGGARPERPGGEPAMVYLNGHEHGDLHILHTIPAAMVSEVRFLAPTEAASRFGKLHPGGVIAVRTRPQ